jgi:tetratricopeptide (TPR) repeat protein
VKHGQALLLLLWLLTGCSGLPVSGPDEPAAPVQENLPLPPPRPSVAIVEARELGDQGRWNQALEILRGAHWKYPENEELTQLLEQMEKAWSVEKRRLEDRMLVLETSGLLARLPILDQLARAAPDDQVLRSRRQFWKSYLQNKVDALTACGLVEQEQDLWLARRCLELANRIVPEPETARQLEEVVEQIDRQKRSVVVRQRKREQAARERQLQRLLEEAERDLKLGSVTSAMLKLDQARQQAPDEPRLEELRVEAQTALDQRVESLVKLGDRLYREERIGPAVAVWEAVLKLDPNREGVVEKIDRARKVFEKLETIRSRDAASDQRLRGL